MLINCLPDDCLLEIFDKFCCLEDLALLSKVCTRWEYLIIRKLNRVKYLLVRLIDPQQRIRLKFRRRRLAPAQLLMLSHTVKINDPSYIHARKASALLDIDLALLVPNLKVFDFHNITKTSSSIELAQYFKDKSDPPNILNLYEIIRIVKATPSCKGIILPQHVHVPDDVFENGTRLDIEMVGKFSIRQSTFFNHAKLTQGQFHVQQLHDLSEASFHSNIIRLQIEMDYVKEPYFGPFFTRLKVFELTTRYCIVPNRSYFENAFRFVDSCPNLESVYLNIALIESNRHFNVDKSVKNLNLKNLVLSFGVPTWIENKLTWKGSNLGNWSSMKLFISKFPNLENLAIRGYNEIHDGHIVELINLLPNIKLMDFRGSPGVTQKLCGFLEEFCELRQHQPITLYYQCEVEPSYWTRIDVDKSHRLIASEFNFMKFCFFVTSDYLPTFLGP